jgi:putative endonuclease
MHYVYLLRSIARPDQTYVGLTRDLKKRLDAHNAGRSSHTARYAPWQVVAFVGLANRHTAVHFEAYLKSGSGRAFTAKHFLCDTP